MDHQFAKLDTNGKGWLKNHNTISPKYISLVCFIYILEIQDVKYLSTKGK